MKFISEIRNKPIEKYIVQKRNEESIILYKNKKFQYSSK
jgi:hypothetical protein